MAFEPNFEKVVTSVRKNLGIVQSQVEFKLPVEGGVSKVICSNARANILNVETSGKDVVYSGFVSFKFVYLNENMQAESLDYTAEFKDKYSTNMELVNVVPAVMTSVVDVNTSINGDLKVVITLESVIDGVINQSTNVLTNINGDNYFTQKESLKYTNYVDSINSVFELLNDVEIKDGVNRILSVCPSVAVEKVVSKEGFLIVDGSVYYNICYLCDNGVVRGLESSYKFSQELPNDNIDEESLIQGYLTILYNDIKVTTNIDTDNTIVNVVLPMVYQGLIFKTDNIEVVSDMYSSSNYTNVSVESVSTINICDSIVFDEKLNGSISIGDNNPFIDEVVGNCCNNVIIANSMIQDGFLVVEGVATTTVVYYNKESNLTSSVVIEMPFSTSISVECSDDANVAVNANINQITSRARRGKEIEVSAVLDLYCDLSNTIDSVVITKVVEEDEYPENECAMSFYISREGDSIWGVAKELKVSTDLLLNQNENLANPIVAGTKIVVYRQKQAEY